MNNRIKGSIMMIVSAVSLAVMQIMIAMTSGTIPVFEQMIFRNMITAVIAYMALRKKGIREIWGHRENAVLLGARSLFGFLGMFCLFYATGKGNQGEVAILSKLSPFVVILFAMVFLHERIKPYQKWALAIAVAGAFITSNPTFGGFTLPAFSALMCSVFSGVAYFCVGKLRGREDAEVIVLVFSVFTTVICIAVTLVQFVMPSLRDFLLLMGVGVFAAIGQLTLTHAYTLAAASEVSVFNYSGIPVTMLLGLLVLSQPIKITTLIGSVLVIVSAVISFLGDRKK